MRFFPRKKGKMAFFDGFSLRTAIFPVSRGKNRISQGVENRGSLISAPLALRAQKNQNLDLVRNSPKDPSVLFFQYGVQFHTVLL